MTILVTILRKKRRAASGRNGITVNEESEVEMGPRSDVVFLYSSWTSSCEARPEGRIEVLSRHSDRIPSYTLTGHDREIVRTGTLCHGVYLLSE